MAEMKIKSGEQGGNPALYNIPIKK